MYEHRRGTRTNSRGSCSVVWRQMWLRENKGMPKAKAYDTARREFYDMRYEEQVEARIAREEALWVGAYFGKTRLEISMGIEDEAYEDWKQWDQRRVLGRKIEHAYGAW